MAGDCISVKFEDGTQWEYCWDDVTPYSDWNYTDVSTGLRASTSEGARAWRTCQYFLRGMPTVCEWFKRGAGPDGGYGCSYESDNTSEDPNNPKPEIPSGFNFGQCDFLGRRSWCSAYSPSGEYDPDEWICTAPNPYVTGLGEKSLAGNKDAVFTSIKRDDIWGYNEGEGGEGRCDCHGWGRGERGCSISRDSGDAEDRLSELPVACNLYRPYQMGFGIISPAGKSPGDVEPDNVTITKQGWERAQAWENDDGYDTRYRLPLNYKLFNDRARFQKCQWWDEDSGREYHIDEYGATIYLEGDPDIFDDAGKVEFCKCPHSDAGPFNTRVLEELSQEGGAWEDHTGAQLALDGVWAKGGGPVCNGARPECPCYTGEWIYVTSSRTQAGMPITANQVLELRFWASTWDSQDEYDTFYNIKPNFDDPHTPAIYTFTNWKKIEDDSAESGVTKSKIVGKKLWLCQPSPLHMREFTKAYIDSEDVEYHHAQIGTSTAGGQRHYPNLVREHTFPDFAPLVVVYPPYDNDYFNSEICRDAGQPGYTKRANDIKGDRIKTIGQTYTNKQVYVINTSRIPISSMLGYFPGVYAIRDNNVFGRPVTVIKEDVYNFIREAISRGYAEAPEYISRSASDGDFGFFIIPEVRLDYSKNPNLLLVCVDLGDGTWEYRWREVNSIWYGGIVKQTEYVHVYEDNSTGWENKVPRAIEPGGTALADIVAMGGARGGEGQDIVSTFSLDNLWTGERYFDYAYEQIEEEDVSCEFWGGIGQSNKILVELEDKNINYIYDWEIINAKLVYIGDEDYPPGGLPDEVELESVIEDDNYIGAAMAILQPVDEEHKMTFRNSQWELVLDYKYIHLTNSPGEGIVVYGGGKDELDVLVGSPYNIFGGGGSVEVNGISRGSAQFMTHFKDENGRVINAFATKMLTQIVKEGCRGVDIFYRYSAEGRQYALQPRSGFCIDVKQDSPLSSPYKHVEVPNCGDHLHSWQVWEGPMWFPYNVCRGYDMYDEFTVCNNCQAGYVGPDSGGNINPLTGEKEYVGGGTVLKRWDYRYCGPYKYDAFGDVRGNWAASCDCGCDFWYSDAESSSVIFAGRVYKRGPVDLGEYSENGWYPPPFGNTGREYVEKYLSEDYITHLIPFIVDGVLQRADWMPLMMDHSSFYSGFNSYDDDYEDKYIGIAPDQGFEPFRYFHQLTMATSAAVSEERKPVAPTDDEIEDDPETLGGRYRWDELFEVHHEGNSSYPLPTYPIGTIATKAVFYYLKKQKAAWAWQEDWKEIDRNASDNLPETDADEDNEYRTTDVGFLDFVDLKKAPYIWDYYKHEHRTISDEGNYEIVYTAPVFEEGFLSVYPTLSINGSHPRAFEVLYGEDDYVASQPVDWNDEGGAADTDAGQGEDNIYEKTYGSDWIHEDNMLFDSSAVFDIEDADAAERKATVGKTPDTGINQGYIYGYYNRGIIAEMTRDRLYYLPKEETIEEMNLGDASSEGVSNTGIPGSSVWDAQSVEINYSTSSTAPLSRIVVRGIWGEIQGQNDSDPPRPTVHTVVRPGIRVSCNFNDGSSGAPRGISAAAASPEYPASGEEEYIIYMDFLVGPYEMANKIATEVQVTLNNATGSYISVDSIELYFASYIDIKYENIKIYERKYIASQLEDIGGQGINLDGPGDHLKFDDDMLNMGQYFSLRDSRFANKEVVAVDKTKVIVTGISHPDDERIVGVTYDNLHETEAKEQRDLYEYAYNLDPTSDTTNYAPVAPYRCEAFLDTIGETFPSSTLTINSEKLPFERHWRYKEFRQYDFWRPGGHYYTWSSSFRREKCMLFGGPENVFSGRYIHVDHQGIGTPLEQDASKPIYPGNSYYSLRFYTQQAKYDRAMILAGGDPEYTDKWGIGGGVSAGTFT